MKVQLTPCECLIEPCHDKKECGEITWYYNTQNKLNCNHFYEPNGTYRCIRYRYGAKYTKSAIVKQLTTPNIHEKPSQFEK